MINRPELAVKKGGFKTIASYLLIMVAVKVRSAEWRHLAVKKADQPRVGNRSLTNSVSFRKSVC